MASRNVLCISRKIANLTESFLLNCTLKCPCPVVCLKLVCTLAELAYLAAYRRLSKLQNGQCYLRLLLTLFKVESNSTS